MNGERVYFPNDLGVKISVLKTRTVQECLHCEKYQCNGCPIYEYDDKEKK